MKSIGTGRRRIVVAAVAVVVGVIVLRAPALLHPRAIDDEAVYSVVADRILDGGLPYVDAVERKPPLLFGVYALVRGAFGRADFVPLHVFATLWVLATMAILAGIAAALHGSRAALWAAVLYGLYCSWGDWRNLAFNGEMAMNLPLVAALALTLVGARQPAWMALAGALVALAALLKQPAAIAWVPMALHLLAGRDRLARVAAFAGGSALVLLASGLVLSRLGILSEALYWTIGDHDVPHGPRDPVFWTRAAKFTSLFLLACTPLVWGAAQSIRPSGLGQWSGRGAERRALTSLLVASVVGVAASGRFYPHYYIQLIPVLALLAAPWFASRPWERTQHLLTARGLGSWLSSTALVFVVLYGIGLVPRRDIPDVARFVRQRSLPADRLFVWGQSASMYLDAGLAPASRYVNCFPLTGWVFGSPLATDPRADTSHRILPGAWDVLEDELRRRPPRFVIDTHSVAVPKYGADRFPRLRSLLAREYHEVFRSKKGVVFERRAIPTRSGL